MVAEGLYVCARSSSSADYPSRGIYQLDPSTGTPTLVIPFTGVPTSGSGPWKPMIRPSDGSVYVNNFGTDLYLVDESGLVASYTMSGGVLGGGAWYNDILYLPDAGGNGRLVSFDPSTETFTTILDNLYNLDVSLWPGEDLCIYGDRIYAEYRDTPGSDTYIWSCNLDGTGQRAEWNDTTSSGVLGISVIGDYIYGSESGPFTGEQVLRWPISSVDGTLGTAEVVWTMSGTNPAISSVATDGTNLFIGGNKGIVFKIASLASPTTESEFWNTQDIDGFFADVEYVVYFTPTPTCWNWEDLGALPGDADFGVVVSSYWTDKGTLPNNVPAELAVVTADETTIDSINYAQCVFFCEEGGHDVHAAKLADLSHFGWAFSFASWSYIYGMAIDATDEVWFVVTQSGHPSIPGEVSYLYHGSGGSVTMWTFWNSQRWEGHAVVNPVDGYLYVADRHGDGASTTYLWKVNISSGTDRTAVVTLNGSQQISGSLAITPDGAVWYITDDGTDYQIHRYDGSTVVSGPTFTGYTASADPWVSGNSVITYRSDGVYSYSYQGGSITETLMDAPGHPSWLATHNGYAVDGTNLWSYGRKVFYSTDGDAYIHSASYPDLTSTDPHSDGGWPYTYLLPYVPADNLTRYIQGMTLGPAGELYVLVRRQDVPSTDGGAEIWEFDTSNLNDTGTVVFYDPNDGGSNTGEMWGHIKYNPVDDRIYIAERHGYWDGAQYFSSLASVDRTTWTRTNHVVFNNGSPATTPPFVSGKLAITPDGGVWFFTQTTGGNNQQPTSIHRYDPVVDTSVSLTISNFPSGEPLALNDNSVIYFDLNGACQKFVFDGSAITQEAFTIADTTPNPWSVNAWMAGTHDAHVFDGSNLWTYNTVCPVGGCSDVITLGWIAFSPC